MPLLRSGSGVSACVSTRSHTCVCTHRHTRVHTELGCQHSSVPSPPSDPLLASSQPSFSNPANSSSHNCAVSLTLCGRSCHSNVAPGGETELPMRKVLGVGQSPGARGMESPHTRSRSSAIPACSPESEQGRWVLLGACLPRNPGQKALHSGGVRKGSAG